MRSLGLLLHPARIAALTGTASGAMAYPELAVIYRLFEKVLSFFYLQLTCASPFNLAVAGKERQPLTRRFPDDSRPSVG
jgi:hypothetical protein